MPFLLWHTCELDMVGIGMERVLVRVVFGLDNDSPSRRKDAVVDIEFIGFEEEAPEYWNDG